MDTGDPECKTTRRLGCDLHYWMRGRADASVIVFTHGLGLDHHLFDAQVAAFSDDYRTVTWDIRGHGLSQPAGAFSPDILAADLELILDEITARPVILVGQSLGGNIVQHFAATRPGRVQAAVLIGCSRNSAPSRRWRTEVTVAHLLMKGAPWARVRRELAKRTAIHARSRDYAYAATGLLDPDDARRMWGTLPQFLVRRPVDVIGPTMLVRGARDGMGGFRRQMPGWAADVGGTYEVIPDAGHNANQDNPEAFNRHLFSFLGRLPRSS